MSHDWSEMGDEGQITAAQAGDPFFAQQQMARGQTAQIDVNRDAFINLLGQRNHKAKELDALKRELADMQHVLHDQPTVILITIDTGEDGGNGAYANFAGDDVSGPSPDYVAMALFNAARTLAGNLDSRPAVIAFQNAVNNHLAGTGSELIVDGIYGPQTDAAYNAVLSSPKFQDWFAGNMPTSFGDEGQITAAQMGDPNFASQQLRSGDVQQIKVNRKAFELLFQQRAQLDQAIQEALLQRQALINEIH